MNYKEILEAVKKTVIRNLYAHNRKNSTRNWKRIEIHAYHAYNFCARQIILAKQNNIHLDKHQKWPPQTLFTFRLGEKIEEMMIELMNGEKPPTIKTRIGSIPIRGNPDFLIRVNGKRYVVECKSIKKEDYLALNEPLIPHKYQLMYYLYLGKKLGLDYEYDLGFILYVPKQQTQDIYKMFPMKYDEKIEKIFDKQFRELKAAMKTGRLPERICKASGSSMAKNCPVVYLCFKEEERTFGVNEDS